MASRIIQTRGVGRVDLVKLGIKKQTNNGKAKGKGKSSVKGKVSDESPDVIVGTEMEEAATDGVLLSVHAEGSIDDDDSELELDYDEEIGLIETDGEEINNAANGNRLPSQPHEQTCSQMPLETILGTYTHFS